MKIVSSSHHGYKRRSATKCDRAFFGGLRLVSVAIPFGAAPACCSLAKVAKPSHQFYGGPIGHQVAFQPISLSKKILTGLAVI